MFADSKKFDFRIIILLRKELREKRSSGLFHSIFYKR